MRNNFFFKVYYLALISSMTIAFSNSSPKIPNSGIYTNNFVFMKLRIKENLRVLISKMPIIFFKFQSEDTQIQYFLGKI